MTAQGIITVPVQNGKVTKTQTKQKNNASSNTEFMAYMNELNVAGRSPDQNNISQDDKAPTAKDSATKESVTTIARKSRVVKSSYSSDSQNNVIKQTDNSKSSTETKKTNDPSDKVNTDKKTDAKTKKTKDNKEADKTQKNKKTESKKTENRDTSVSGPETEDNTVDEDETVNDFTSDILEQIKESLGTDDKTVLDAMQTLGLSFADLQIPNNAAQLYMTITGATQADLITSDDFTSFVSDLNDLFSEIPDDMLSQMQPVDDDEARELLSYLDDYMTDEEMTADGTTIEDDMPLDVTVVNVETSDTEDDDTTPSINQAADTVTADDTASDPTQVVNTPVVETQQDNTDSESMFNGSANQQSMSGRNEEPADVSTQINTNAAQATATTNQTDGTFAETISKVSRYTDINTDNVISQIVDKARQTLSSTVRSVEMELNPHNLGRIFLQVAEKSGDVSAHLYAENEAVRHALENRLADLQENLNKQGVRVNEVTISVEPHAFERNLEQNASAFQDNNSNNFSENGRPANRSAARTIDVRDGVVADQSAEDALEAQVMRDNGNSVSYFA